MLTIARDHVVPAGEPQGWNLLLLRMGLSSADGLYPWYAVLFGKEVPINDANTVTGRYYMPYEMVTTMMYLKISISDFLTLFAARTRGPFWSRAPSMPLVSAFVVATVVATVISTAVNIYDATYPMHKINFKAACFVWGWNIFFFFVQDAAKLALYEVTERFEIFKPESTSAYAADSKTGAKAAQAGEQHEVAEILPSDEVN